MLRLSSVMGLILVMVMTGVVCAAGDAAGIVIIAKGSVVARSAGQADRPLKRRSRFHVGETIVVGKNARVQLRFADGSIVSLRSETELRIDSFQFGEGQARESNIVTLLKGGFRTITGAVAKKQPKAHQVKTPVATIGVRGTAYSAVLSGELYVGVWRGGVVVENQGGRLDLGADQDFSFARVDAADLLPKGLLEPPAVLMPAGRFEGAAADRHRRNTVTDRGARDRKGEPAQNRGPTETSRASEDPARVELSARGDRGETGAAQAEEGEGSVRRPGRLQAGERRLTGQLGEEGRFPEQKGRMALADGFAEGGADPPFDEGQGRLSKGDSGDYLLEIVNPVTEGQPVDEGFIVVGDALTDSTTVLSSADRRFTREEWDSLVKVGLGVIGGVGANRMFLGKASDSSAPQRLLAVNGLGPDDPEFATAVFTDVLRRGTALEVFDINVPLIGLEMGAWGGTLSDPFFSQIAPDDPGVRIAYPDTLFWASFVPTPAAVVSGKSGVVAYRNVVDYTAGSNLGQVTDVYMRTNVDFATSGATGSLHLHMDNGWLWDVRYDGQVLGTELSLTVDPAASELVHADNSTQPVDGLMQTLFGGLDGTHIVGAFDFQTTAGALYDVDGLFVANDVLLGDLRLSAAEQASLDRLGMVRLRHPLYPVVTGRASAGAGGRPLIASDATDTANEFADVIVKPGTAPVIGPFNFNVSGYDVNWGTWNASVTDPVELHENGDDPLLVTPVAQPAQWMTVEPTPLTVIAAHASAVPGKTGTWVGTLSPGQFFGRDDTNTAISAMSFSGTVDFATGTVTGVTLDVMATDVWNVGFADGVLNNGRFQVQVDPLASTGTNRLSGNTLDGRMDGVITGSNAEGIAGMFRLRSVEQSQIDVTGGFVSVGTISP